MLFEELRTQWRVGFNGRIGMDYSVLFARMTQIGLAGEAFEAMFGDIRHMEREALRVIAQSNS